AVLCMSGGPARMVRVKLAERLPTTATPDSPYGPATIIVVLADGETCLPAGGATGLFNGLRLNYGCDRGVLYGYPDHTRATWSISYKAEGSEAVVSVPIAEAYQ